MVACSVPGNAISCAIWQWHFSSSANCRSRRCCNASLSHSRMYERIARTFLARSRTWSPRLRERHVRLPYSWGYISTTLAWLAPFEKRHPRPLGQISVWFTTIQRQGTFFISHPVIRRPRRRYIRVTTVSCLQLLLQSAAISHRPPPRHDVISYRIVSGSFRRTRVNFDIMWFPAMIAGSLGPFTSLIRFTRTFGNSLLAECAVCFDIWRHLLLRVSKLANYI